MCSYFCTVQSSRKDVENVIAWFYVPFYYSNSVLPILCFCNCATKPSLWISADDYRSCSLLSTHFRFFVPFIIPLKTKYVTSQNGQTHFKNLKANAARFLKCVWPFWDVMHLDFRWYRKGTLAWNGLRYPKLVLILHVRWDLQIWLSTKEYWKQYERNICKISSLKWGDQILDLSTI